MDPSGKVCVVTGGAQGLGKEVTKQLLQRGAKVCILDMEEELGTKTATEFQSQYGNENVIFIHCDVTIKENLEEAFSRVVSDLGGLDILFNNAGVHGYVEPRERVIGVNLLGAIDVMELAISRMRTDTGGKGGVIVCTSSMLGIIPIAITPEYHASKAGLIGYTRSRALECGKKYGISFRIIAPNIMHTKLFLDGFEALTADLNQVLAEASDEVTHAIEVSHAARTVLMCIEKGDLPQGALIKIVKDGSFLVFPEKTPFEKVMDS